MPLTQLTFQAGIDTENTETGAEGRWIDCDKIRFRKGLPQKIGGWTKQSEDYYVGVGRALFTWYDLSGFRYTGLGTDRKVYVYRDGTDLDITPIRQTNAITSVFDTTATSANITVNHTAHGANVGDFITVSNCDTSVGGITASNVDAEYEILSITNADAYVIQSNQTASTSNTNVANCTIAYQIPVGPEVQTFGYGWNAGAWSDEAWNEPRSSSIIDIDLRQYSLNNWGEDLIITVKDGSTYEWNTSNGTAITNRATLVANAPTKSILSVVSNDTRHLICMGTETTIGNTSTQDKMFIRWSDQENYNSWQPNTTNSAGSQRLAGGSEIRAARPAKGTILVWTDTTLHSMSFVGTPFIFGFRQLGNDCGAVGLNSAIVIDDVAYWMSDGQFFRYAGAVQEIPCTVLNHVFDDINKTQFSQVYAGQNSDFSEVIWYYCSANSDQIDRYVIFNHAEGSWYFGNMERGAYLENGVYDNPIAAQFYPTSTANTISQINGLTAGRSLIYNQEVGVDADGSAITAYIESGDGDIADGENFSFINKVIPDFKNQTGNATITLKARDYPNSTRVSGEVITVSNTTPFYNSRIRGRQSSVRIESSELGSNWRFGTLRINVRPDGKR